MPWQPDTYNKFKKERYKPFFDLISHIQEKPGMKIIDLGCGTGELTKILAEKFEDSSVLGIDNSAEMLAQAPGYPSLSFELKTIEEMVAAADQYDLIVSNAALQWVDEHEALFNKIISKLNPGGQLAVQMPSQTENLLNLLLLQLVQASPYKEVLNGWARLSPVLSLQGYSTLFFKRQAKEMIVYEKVYPVIGQTHDVLYDFISGSALVPYMERLPEDLKEQLAIDFKRKIEEHFPELPALYAFRRIILYANWV